MLIYFYSFKFIFYFSVFLVIYWFGIPQKHKNKFLLVGSYAFYASFNWKFLSLLLTSTLVDYFCSHKIEKEEKTRLRKRYLYISIFVNLILLSFFKYFNFFIDSAHLFLNKIGIPVTPWSLNVVLPLGISFYTFQTMGYTIDVYFRRVKPVASILDFGLYVSYFPQLVAGPIEKAKNLLPQLLAPKKVTGSQLQEALFLFCYGFFQKRAIADSVGLLVEQYFDTWQKDLNGGVAWLVSILYLIQVYCDFSGYSKMARGISLALGIRLHRNFWNPLWSKTPSEFWSKWHITFSSWIRQYLYFPLLARWKNPIAVSALCFPLIGLWHGASWGHVLWGVYWFLATVIYNFAKKLRFIKYLKLKLPDSVTSIILILILFNVSAVGLFLINVDSTSQYLQFVTTILDFTSWSGSDYEVERSVILGLFLMFAFEALQNWKKDELIVVRWSFYFQVVFYVCMFFLYRQIEHIGDYQFIYFQF